MRQHGFTLIELLIVLAVLGILMGLFGMSYLRSVRAAEVREGANQIAADLRAARASAQRHSEGATLRWAAGSNLANYTLELPTGTASTRVARRWASSSSLPRSTACRSRRSWTPTMAANKTAKPMVRAAKVRAARDCGRKRFTPTIPRGWKAHTRFRGSF